MTLKFSESPAVQIKEIDLTGVVPGVTSTTGAIVGDFNWGPVDTPVLIGNEAELAAVFGTPKSGKASAGHFLCAAHFLKYSSSLYVSRASSTDGDKASFASEGLKIFTAKHPGKLGDSITVHVVNEDLWENCPTGAVDDEGNVVFEPWPYQNLFSDKPDDELKELHVLVLQGDDVVDTFEYVSYEKGDQLENGTQNYIVDVVNSRSSWIEINKTVDLSDGPFQVLTGPGAKLTGGEDGTAPSYDYSVFKNTSEIQVDFLIAPFASTAAIDGEVADIAFQRKDCVAVASVPYNDVVNGSFETYNTSLNKNSSYLVVDGNHIRVYNKYEDTYEWIPAASSTAGVMAATDAVSAPWFSPAGSRRGQYLGVTELLINPTKTERDVMYKLGINPIVSFSGQGVMLYGDKTHLTRPSAFDRINVRRLFLVIERAISQAGENVMFEFNDEFTRAEFVNIVEPFLREIQGRRGITDFRVVCDDTNNTPEVVDRNEFVASCFIKPARSINYVTLNFVAVRTGVEFEEVVGTTT